MSVGVECSVRIRPTRAGNDRLASLLASVYVRARGRRAARERKGDDTCVTNLLGWR